MYKVTFKTTPVVQGQILNPPDQPWACTVCFSKFRFKDLAPDSNNCNLWPCPRCHTYRSIWPIDKQAHKLLTYFGEMGTIN